MDFGALFVWGSFCVFMGSLLGIHIESKKSSVYFENGRDHGKRFERETTEKLLGTIRKLKTEIEVQHQLNEKLLEYIKKYNDAAYCESAKFHDMTGEENPDKLYIHRIVLPAVQIGFYSPYSGVQEIKEECGKLAKTVSDCGFYEECGENDSC